MKYLPLLLIAAIISCKNKNQDTYRTIIVDTIDNVVYQTTLVQRKPPEFHLQIRSILNMRDYKLIEFTNDNWETKESILNDKGVYFSFFTWDRNYPQIEALAKSLDTYEKCIKYNERMKRIAEKNKPKQEAAIAPIKFH